MEVNRLNPATWSIRTKAGLVLISQAAAALAAFGSLIIVGRMFEPSAFGAFSLAMAAASFLTLFSDLGLVYAFQREIAQGQVPASPLRVLVSLRVGLLLLVVVLMLGTTLAFEEALDPFLDVTTWSILCLAMFIHAASIVRSFLEATWQAQQRIHLVESLRLLDSLLGVVFLVQAGLILAASQGASVPFVAVGVFWMNVLGLPANLGVEGSALLIAASYLLAKILTFPVAIRWAVGDRLRLGAWDTTIARRFLRLAAPVSLATVLSLILTSTDTLVVGWFWDAREVADYTVAMRLAQLCVFIGTAVAAVLVPRFAELQAKGSFDSQQATFYGAQRYLVLLAAPVAMALAILPGPAIAATAGPLYLASSRPLVWLAGWAFITILGQPIAARLLGEGRTQIYLIASTLSAILNLVLDLVFVPLQVGGTGATGASVATLLAALAGFAFLRFSTWRLHGVQLLNRSLVRIGIAACVAGLFWWASLPIWPLDAAHPLRHTASLLVAGVGIYVAALAVMGELEWKELRAWAS